MLKKKHFGFSKKNFVAVSQLCLLYAGIGHVGDVHTHNLVPPRGGRGLEEGVRMSWVRRPV